MAWSGKIGERDPNKRDYLIPLELGPDDKLEWPPRMKPGYKVFKRTQEHWEKLIRALAERPETVKRFSSRTLRERAGLPDMTSSAGDKLYLELEHLGVIERDLGPRQCDGIRLTVPVEWLPDVLLPERVETVQQEPEPIIEEGSPVVETMQGLAGSQHPSAQAVAAALLDLVLDKAESASITKEQLDELVARLASAQKQLIDLQDHEAALVKLRDALKAENHKVKEENRSFRIRIDHLEEANKGLEGNFQTAVKEVERLQRLNGTAPSNTQARLDRISRGLPSR
jgi:hypothetical protein